MEEKDNFENNLNKLDQLVNEEHEFESFIGDEDFNENEEEEYKNLNFDELEKRAFYEYEY